MIILLFCEACGTTHRFTAGEVEQIVYSLQGMLSDAELRHAQGEKSYLEKNRSGYFEAGTDCLEQIVGEAGDSECYAEWTGSLVEARQAAQRDPKPCTKSSGASS